MKNNLYLFIFFVFCNLYCFSQGDSLMQFDIEDLMQISITSASKEKETHFDSPLSTSVITASDIKNSGATTIEELFRLIPKFIVREKTNGNFDIHIQGNDNTPPGNFTFNSANSLSLVMIDGRKVYNQMNGGTFWETLPISLTDIEQIEIIKNPSTSLYGPNAVTGVINIITKKIIKNKAFSINANLQGGTQNTTTGNISLTNQLGKLMIGVSGSFDKRQRFETTYYNYNLQQYVPKDSIIDWQNPVKFVNTSSIDKRYENPLISKEKKGANLFLNYHINQDVKFHSSFSSQKSFVQTVFMENTTTPLSFRESFTHSANLQAQIHNLSMQFSTLTGTQDLYKGFDDLHKYDLTTIDGNIEYHLKSKNKRFSVRPGVNYQYTQYNDEKYLTEKTIGRGLLNGEKSLYNIGVSLRLDTKISHKFRVIAATRVDKYQYPDEFYFSYQFISTYKVNKNHLLRALISRANRGAFIVDIHTNYASGDAVYTGNKKIKLPVMNLFEIGSRHKLGNNLHGDFDIFYTQTNNFTGLEFSHINSSEIAVISYRNYPTISKQYGASLAINFTPSNKFRFKIFGTLQKTTLDNFEKDSYDFSYFLATNGEIAPIPTSDTIPSIKHKNTPTLYGGMIITYTPIKKLTIFSNLYFYTQQEYWYQGIPTFSVNQNTGKFTNTNTVLPINTITSKARIDLKISYKVWKNNTFFFNGRNILNTQTNEFGFTEKIGGLYLIGCDFSF